MPSVSSLLTAILPGGSGADGGGSWLEYADRFDRPPISLTASSQVFKSKVKSSQVKSSQVKSSLEKAPRRALLGPQQGPRLCRKCAGQRTSGDRDRFLFFTAVLIREFIFRQ